MTTPTKQSLSDQAIQNAQASLVSRIELRDNVISGLSVLIGKQSVSWYLRYKDGPKRPRKLLGTFPDMNTSAAREAAEEVLRGLQDSGGRTVESCLELYLDHLRLKGSKSIYEIERCLRKNVMPYVGNKDVTKVRREHLVDAFDTIKAPMARNRTIAITRAMFNYLADRGVIDHQNSPVVRLGKLSVREATRERVLTDREWELVWGISGHLECPGYFGRIVRLLMLTGCRRGEIAALRPEWIDLAHDGGWLCLPSSIMKNAQAHKVWLTPRALDVLGTTDDDTFFPSGISWSRYSRKLWSTAGIRSATLHDIRRTMATRMQKAGVLPHVIERCLAHKAGGVKAIYQRHDYDEEAREAWELIAEQIAFFDNVIA